VHPHTRFHNSAFKHGISLEQAAHALRLPLYHGALIGLDIDNKFLIIGVDESGKLLELIYLLDKDGDALVIHAMKCRPIHFQLLPKGNKP
jgi:hypothetical protein